jgi:hypothetical protein
MAKSSEEKLAEKITDELSNHYFNVSVLANVLTTYYPIYTQDRLMELVKYIIKYNSIRMKSEWEANEVTSDGLLLADALNDLIETIRPEPPLVINQRTRDSKYLMDLDSF